MHCCVQIEDFPAASAILITGSKTLICKALDLDVA
jgi:hypothetical protein